MGAPAAGISEADWLATETSSLLAVTAVGALIVAEQDELEQLRTQLNASASALAQLRRWIGRSSGNSSKPPSSVGPELLPIAQLDEVMEHHPEPSLPGNSLGGQVRQRCHLPGRMLTVTTALRQQGPDTASWSLTSGANRCSSMGWNGVCRPKRQASSCSAPIARSWPTKRPAWGFRRS